MIARNLHNNQFNKRSNQTDSLSQEDYLMPVSQQLVGNNAILEQLTELIAKMPRGEQLSLLNELEERFSKLNRRHLRILLRTSVEYSTKDRSDKGFTHDISGGGVFIETRMPFRSEEDIYLNFILPEDPETLIRIHGRIARISPNGIGVEFKSLTEDQNEFIKSFQGRS